MYYFINQIYLYILFSTILISISILFAPLSSFGQPSLSSSYNFSLASDLVTYNKKSNFIKEFEIPQLKEQGLKGITTDSKGNVWFYHSTNKTSTIFRLEPTHNSITSYNITGNTKVDMAIMNLAGGQLLFDKERNYLWFTDARTNSIGKLDVLKGKIELIEIPTENSGVMGIGMSQNKSDIWFTEIMSNKIGKLDINSNKIDEYYTGDQTGPTLLTFDRNGILWVTLSYGNGILRVEPKLLDNNKSNNSSSSQTGMSIIRLPKSDGFSPFGIAAGKDKNGMQKLFVSDHSSNRVIATFNDVNPYIGYISYWTSPLQDYSTTLPSQIVTSNSGDVVYFPQHVGNKITKIDVSTGIMTEYDIPTGPISTAVYITITDDGKRVWFTEWAANKVAYLDTTIPIPLSINIGNLSSIPLQLNVEKPTEIPVNLKTTNNVSTIASSSLSLKQVDLAVTGMTESGLKAISYDVEPQRIDMQKNASINAKVYLTMKDFDRTIIPTLDQYTIMIGTSLLEKESQQTRISLHYPITVSLSMPSTKSTIQSISSQSKIQEPNPFFNISLRDIIKTTAILVIIGLIAYLVFSKIHRIKLKRRLKDDSH